METNLLALSGFLTEAVLFIAARQADRCKGKEREKKPTFLDFLQKQLKYRLMVQFSPQDMKLKT